MSVLRRYCTTAVVAALLTAPLHAIQDSNGNGLSDVWEKFYNNDSLFPATAPYLAGNDPDGDGWSNAEESVAGTDPFSAALPEGWVRTTIMAHPEVQGCFMLSWPSIAGKGYQLSVSTNLVDWADCGEVMAGTGTDIELALDCEYEEGGTPERMFWRVRIEDADPDSDGLTTWEEMALQTDPYHPDTDRDGIIDNEDADPLISATLANPDGLGLPASLDNGLVGRWDFEQIGSVGGAQSFADLAGGDQPLECSGNSLALDPLGMVSRGVQLDAAGDYLNGPASLLSGRATFTTSFWFKFEKDFIQTKPNAINTILFAYNNDFDAAPELILSVIKPLFGSTTQKLVLSHFHNGTLQPDWVLEIPESKWLDDGSWRHLAFVKRSGAFEIFLDGLTLGTASTFSTSWTASPSGYFCFGKGAPNAIDFSHTFRGSFDRARFYSRDLSGGEVEALFKQDIDSDGLWDVTEARTSLWRDLNSNALRESNEHSFISSPFEWQFPHSDSDGDEATDLEEQTAGTLIGQADSDGDLLPDGWELLHELDPLVSNATDTNSNGTFENVEYTNSDSDALTDIEEYRYNTNPKNSNSDGGDTTFPDLVNDADEIAQGSLPNDPRDGGEAPDPAVMLPMLLGVGDESGSESEDYVLNCYRLDPDTGEEVERVYTHRSGGYGEYKETAVGNVFRKGVTYSFQIHWQGSKLTSQSSGGGHQAEGPDFDYTFKVVPQGTNPGGFIVDSWDPDNGVVLTSSPLLGEEKSNVAADRREFRENIESGRVVLYSIALQSRDRMLGGSVQLLPGFEALELTITNEDTEQSIGTYGYLDGSGGTHVYAGIFGMLGPEDDDGAAVQDPSAWFVRAPDSAQRVEFYLISGEPGDPEHGTIQVECKLQGISLGSVSHTLTPEPIFGEAIESVAKWASGDGFNFDPQVVTGALQSAAWATPVLIHPFLVTHGVENMTILVQGIGDGVVAGLSDDWEFIKLIVAGLAQAGDWAWQQALAELHRWQEDPVMRIRELKGILQDFFETQVFALSASVAIDLTSVEGWQRRFWDGVLLGFQGTQLSFDLWDSTVVGVKGWFDDFTGRMLVEAEEDAWLADSYETGSLLAEGTAASRAAARATGYIFGYVCEQAAVGAVSAGTVKIAQVALKGGVKLASKGGAIVVARRSAASVASRLNLLKHQLSGAVMSAELREALEEGFTLASRLPTPGSGGRPILEVIEDGLESFGSNRSLMNWKVLIDDVAAQPRLSQVFLVPGNEVKYLEATATLVHRLGTNTSPEAMRQWPRLCNALAPLNEGAIANDVFRTEDLFAALKFDTAQGQQVMKELLESLEGKTAAEILDGPALPASIKNVYPTMYHYSEFSTIDDFAQDLGSGLWRLEEYVNGGRRYVTPEIFDTQQLSKSKLQLPLNSALEEIPTKGRFRFESVTSDEAGEYVIPRANVHSGAPGSGLKNWVESIVKDNPSRGGGGVPQFVEKEAREGTLFDTVTQQYVTDKSHLQQIMTSNP